jgi:large subunit ribosomal protein L21e
MVQRIGSSIRKSRSLFRKDYKRKGKRSTKEYFKELKEGDKVVLKTESSSPESRFHSRFYGKCGQVIGKRGRCYKVRFKDMKKEKTLIVHPIHLKKLA